MRVASNQLKHSLDFFISELNALYDEAEIKALFDVACHYYLNFSKIQIQTNLNANINQSDLLKLVDCCKRLKTGIPVQYILTHAWFYNLKFLVNPSVLIPRPETEELVDLILKENTGELSFLDIGTGSGCIPISIKKNKPNAQVYGCDISEDALQVANLNGENNTCDVEFFKTNILDETAFFKDFKNKVDVIISNPPYIKYIEKEAMHKNVLNYEPHLALFVEDNDAIVFYKKIINVCKTHLNKNGKLYFELNPLTANEVKIYADESNQFKSINLINDLSGATRFFNAIKK